MRSQVGHGNLSINNNIYQQDHNIVLKNISGTVKIYKDDLTVYKKPSRFNLNFANFLRMLFFGQGEAQDWDGSTTQAIDNYKLDGVVPSLFQELSGVICGKQSPQPFRLGERYRMQTEGGDWLEHYNSVFHYSTGKMIISRGFLNWGEDPKIVSETGLIFKSGDHHQNILLLSDSINPPIEIDPLKGIVVEYTFDLGASGFSENFFRILTALFVDSSQAFLTNLEGSLRQYLIEKNRLRIDNYEENSIDIGKSNYVIFNDNFKVSKTISKEVSENAGAYYNQFQRLFSYAETEVTIENIFILLGLRLTGGVEDLVEIATYSNIDTVPQGRNYKANVFIKLNEEQ